MRNFHLPLPEGAYSLLRAEAERSQTTSTALARQAIEWWLSAVALREARPSRLMRAKPLARRRTSIRLSKRLGSSI